MTLVENAKATSADFANKQAAGTESFLLAAKGLHHSTTVTVKVSLPTEGAVTEEERR